MKTITIPRHELPTHLSVDDLSHACEAIGIDFDIVLRVPNPLAGAWPPKGARTTFRMEYRAAPSEAAKETTSASHSDGE
ncbi:hypothetical protein [Caldimonas sp. KR1-144]|uniref:hypothetical protein n=1 Tax=Caldimonas sp. KR1-144 TaxID=3400911 RepID=UPI003BFD1B5E